MGWFRRQTKSESGRGASENMAARDFSITVPPRASHVEEVEGRRVPQRSFYNSHQPRESFYKCENSFASRTTAAERNTVHHYHHQCRDCHPKSDYSPSRGCHHPSFNNGDCSHNSCQEIEKDNYAFDAETQRDCCCHHGSNIQLESCGAAPTSGNHEVTTDVITTTYACYDPNCRGGTTCEHYVSTVPGGTPAAVPAAVSAPATPLYTTQPSVGFTPQTAAANFPPQGAPLSGNAMFFTGAPGMVGANVQPLMQQHMLAHQASAPSSPPMVTTTTYQTVSYAPIYGQTQLNGPHAGQVYTGGRASNILVNNTGRPMPMSIDGIPVVVPLNRSGNNNTQQYKQLGYY